MNFKQFFKPDWRKILIFIILLIIFFGIYKYKFPLLAGELPESVPAKGLPLPIYLRVPIYLNLKSLNHLLKVFLMIDLIFWYLISCFIVWIYDKVKKKY